MHVDRTTKKESGGLVEFRRGAEGRTAVVAEGLELLAHPHDVGDGLNQRRRRLFRRNLLQLQRHRAAGLADHFHGMCEEHLPHTVAVDGGEAQADLQAVGALGLRLGAGLDALHARRRAVPLGRARAL